MYAVVGAVSLEKGGHIANKVAQERILEPYRPAGGLGTLRSIFTAF
jgi:hypothetical protein